MSKAAIVYVGRCLTTNKVYVGSSLQGHRRVFAHVRNLKKGRHDNGYLQKAWNKYGEADFVWHLVEECEPGALLERERWWVDFLRAADERYGFNLCYPVTGNVDVKSHLSQCQIEHWRDPKIRGARLKGLKALHNDQAWKDRRSAALKTRWQDPVFKAKMLKVLAKNVEGLVDRNQNEPGFKEHRMRGILPQI